MVLCLVTAPALFKGKKILHSSLFPYTFSFSKWDPLVESVFLGYLHFFFLKRQISLLYHFCRWWYWEEVLYCQCFNLRSTGFSWRICPYLSQLSLCDTCPLFLIQRWGYGGVLFVMFISIILPGLAENRICRGAWKLSPCFGHKEKKSDWKSLIHVLLTWCSFPQVWKKIPHEKFGAWIWRKRLEELWCLSPFSQWRSFPHHLPMTLWMIPVSCGGM